MKSNENAQYSARIEKFKAKFSEMKVELGKAAQLIPEKNAEISSLKESNQLLLDKLNEFNSQSQINASEQLVLAKENAEFLTKQLNDNESLILQLKLNADALNDRIHDISSQLNLKINENDSLTARIAILTSEINQLNLEFNEFKVCYHLFNFFTLEYAFTSITRH